MKLNLTAQGEIKKALGKKAATLVEDGMLVGLGTGSTAVCFIDSLIERCKQGLHIVAVSSSLRSLERAEAGGIPVREMDDVITVDFTADGADEIDPLNRMIKGGGGAHVREKILASSSKRVAIMVDESKLVDKLGAFGLPVEILPFGCQATISKINGKGYFGALRTVNDGSLYITDNGNYIYDIKKPSHYNQPEEDHLAILTIPGVVDTGFFFNLAIEVLIGYADGKITARSEPR